MGETTKPRQLQRNLDKKWTGDTAGEEVSDGGLYPHEIELIRQFQKVISNFQFADKRNNQ